MKVHISFIAGYMSCCCLLTHHGVTPTRHKRQISFRERRPDEFSHSTYASVYRDPVYARPQTFDYWRKSNFPRGNRPSWSSSGRQSAHSRDTSPLSSRQTSGFRFEDDEDDIREDIYPLRTEGRSTSSREDDFSQPSLFNDNTNERSVLFTNGNSKPYFDTSQEIKHSNRQSKVSPVFDTVEPLHSDLVVQKQGSFRDYPEPYNEDMEGRHLSPDTIATISETLGAINTLGRYLVNYTRGSNPSTSGDRLDTPALESNTREEDLPGAIYTISKNVLGRNVTDTIAPLVRVLPIGKVTHDSSLPLCTTPSGRAGYCDDLSNCPQLLLNLGNLRQSICFKSLFVPGVCCPKKTAEQTTLSVVQQPSTTTRRPIILTTKYPSNNAGLYSSTIKPVPGNSIDYEEKDCGKPEVPKFRVVGGEESLPGRWPWMAAIFLHGNRRTEFWCGGSLIGSRHVLTAAHCTKDSRQRPFSVHQFTVRLGDVDLRRDDEPSAPQTYKVVDIRAHPRFSRVGFYNDIAVLVLERPARRSRYVIPVCLPPRTLRNEMFVGESPTVVGWGTTYYGGKESTVQRQAALPVWKNEECDRTYFQPITENFICAGLKEGGKDACQGDSGGPLMIKKEGYWMQIGIVSFGNKCGEPGYPGVYTRITEYLNWISENTVT